MYYRSLNETVKQRFGAKLYKLALDGGMSCPNRDGTLGSEGCIFCLNGSGDFAQNQSFSVSEQLAAAKRRLCKKISDKVAGFIAYYQSYTNTYAPVDYLRRLFWETIEQPEVKVLSIATRPDCLPDGVLRLLCELSQIKPVWVELGLQTIHEPTADLIRRGYKTEVYDSAVKNLHSVGIEVITHMILGLPGETHEMMYQTAQHIGDCGSEGIKLQLLHVLRKTELHNMYCRGEVDVMTMEEYIDLVCDIVERLPEQMVIHRLTGDGNKKYLAAPLWSADKKRTLNALRKRMEQRNVIQGRLYNRQ